MYIMYVCTCVCTCVRVHLGTRALHPYKRALYLIKRHPDVLKAPYLCTRPISPHRSPEYFQKRVEHFSPMCAPFEEICVCIYSLSHSHTHIPEFYTSAKYIDASNSCAQIVCKLSFSFFLLLFSSFSLSLSFPFFLFLSLSFSFFLFLSLSLSFFLFIQLPNHTVPCIL